MKQKASLFFHSITARLLLVLFLLLVPVILLSCYISYCFMQDGLRQVQETHTQLLESYMSQVDRELDLSQNYMNSLTSNNGETIHLTDRSTPAFYYSANMINQEVSRTSLYYQYITGFFLFVPNMDFHYLYFRDSLTDITEKQLQRYLQEECLPTLSKDTAWRWVRINGIPFLLQGSSSGAISGGSFLEVSSLPSMAGEESESGVYFCALSELENIRCGLRGDQYLLTAVSEKGDFAVYEILSRREAFHSLSLLQRYFLLIALFLLLVVPLLYLNIRRLMIRPLQNLSTAMDRLRQGDLEYRVDEQTDTKEFRLINGTFNQMASQIRNLKIEVYEEQLQTEKSKLQNLSYQLRPHFMINALNMAYNMILNSDLENATRMMRFAASYMRYLLRMQDDFVPLSEELEHLEDYMKIQQLRYENEFEYSFEIDPFLDGCSIPNMVLQNFLENSVKYSIGPDHFTTIRLTARYTEQNEQPCAEILVRDNGKGYPAPLLEALDAGDLEKLKDRVGLRNTILRIRMLYQGSAVCSFYNDHGAVTRFVFPMDLSD